MLDFKYELRHSCNKINCENHVTSEWSDISYDPVVDHTIQLRGYYHVIKELFDKGLTIRFPRRRGKAKKDDKRGSKKLKIATDQKLPDLPEIPRYPLRYPFHDTFVESCKKKPYFRIMIKGQLSEKQCRESRIYFVKRVLAHSGYELANQEVEPEENSLPINILADVAHAFLQKFVTLMRQSKDSEAFDDSDDLWNPLETTLQGIGYGGIRGLHKFYIEQVVVKHDAIMNKVLELHNQYEKLKQNELLSPSKREDDDDDFIIVA